MLYNIYEEGEKEIMYDKEQIRMIKTARKNYVDSLIYQLDNWLILDDVEDDRVNDIITSLEKYNRYLSK